MAAHSRRVEIGHMVLERLGVLRRRTCAGTATACSTADRITPMAANTAHPKFAMRRALQDQVLADEVVERGQADAGERGDEKDDGEARRRRRDAAVGRDFERVTALIEEADQDEERAGRDAVLSIW